MVINNISAVLINSSHISGLLMSIFILGSSSFGGFITGILMSISGAFLRGNTNFGLIMGASMCFLSYLIYYFGIQGGASAYRSFWADKYS